MTMEFFNFGNDETFHFFKWICESGQADANDLIANAYKEAEALADDEFEEENICIVVRNHLANTLRDLLWEAAPGERFTLPVEAPEIGCVWDEPESLWLPILVLALNRIVTAKRWLRRC